MKNALYWLWVQRVFGYSAWIADPIRCFGGVKRVYEATEDEYRACEIFGKTRSFSRSRLVLLSDKDLSYAEATLKLCEEHEIRIITPEDDVYPKSLLQLQDYPAVLYVKGDISCLNDHFCLAVIGSRTPTEYAVNAAAKITQSLVSEGAVIISGGALGIDSTAHKAALQKHGTTVLVMGCGIEMAYLPVNLPLRNAISKTGALVSEYPPFMKPTAGSFPQRNRIISGLSSGVLIVEAGARSGTLNTANHAKQQSKPIFVVPGLVGSEDFAGSNQLIREGAKPAFSAQDILSHFDMVFALQSKDETISSDTFFDFENASALPADTNQSVDLLSRSQEHEKPTKQTKATQKHSNASPQNRKVSVETLRAQFSKNAAMVYESIISGKNQMDEIVLSVALPTAKVLSALTELELLGAVSKGEGNFYTVNDSQAVL